MSRFRGRRVVATVSSGAQGTRPTKLAAGMTNTFRRHRGGHSEDANTLAVRGTLDTLAGWSWKIKLVRVESACCPTCGNRSTVWRARLSEHGKTRLAILRAKGKPFNPAEWEHLPGMCGGAIRRKERGGN